MDRVSEYQFTSRLAPSIFGGGSHWAVGIQRSGEREFLRKGPNLDSPTCMK